MIAFNNVILLGLEFDKNYIMQINGLKLDLHIMKFGHYAIAIFTGTLLEDDIMVFRLSVEDIKITSKGMMLTYDCFGLSGKYYIKKSIYDAAIIK